jgi:7,8-dihydropterin-6-yl-methyl-4-(beta-D-ribofuranosyl)aminobenzene 5'-phosphate synthase
LFNGEPDYILSGLHLCDRHKNESEKNIISLADRLKEYKSKIFTCHCTGLYAYGILKEMLGNKIEYAALGWSCEI